MRNSYATAIALYALLLLSPSLSNAQLLINNGLAPPNPANVINAASPDILVRNVGCSGTGACGSPGAATTVEVATGAELVSADAFDSSRIDVTGGGVGDPDFFAPGSFGSGGGVSAHDFASLIMTNGLIESIATTESATASMMGGTVGFSEPTPDESDEFGKVTASGSSFIEITGGTVFGSLAASENGIISMSGVGLPRYTHVSDSGQFTVENGGRTGSGEILLEGSATGTMTQIAGVGTVRFTGSSYFGIDSITIVGLSANVGDLIGEGSGNAVLYGGALGEVDLSERSTLTLHGGSIDHWGHCSYIWDGCVSDVDVTVRDHAHLTANAGTFTTLVAGRGSSRITLNDGLLSNPEAGSEPDLLLEEASALIMNGGSAYLGTLRDVSIAVLTGGSLGEVSGTSGTALWVHGAGFELDGTPVPYGELTLAGDRLTGTLDNGDPLDLYLNNGPWGWANFQGTVQLVPEPASMMLLAAGVLFLAAIARSDP